MSALLFAGLAIAFILASQRKAPVAADYGPVPGIDSPHEQVMVLLDEQVSAHEAPADMAAKSLWVAPDCLAVVEGATFWTGGKPGEPPIVGEFFDSPLPTMAAVMDSPSAGASAYVAHWAARGKTPSEIARSIAVEMSPCDGPALDEWIGWAEVWISRYLQVRQA